MPVIEIWDGASVKLADVLAAVETADRLSWTIMEFWAVARDDETNLVAFEQQAAASPTGLELSADELRSFSGQLLQFIDGIVVGYSGKPPNRSEADLRGASEIVIEAIDSTLWRVYARDSAVIDRLRSTYDDVRNVEPEVAIRPLHEQS